MKQAVKIVEKLISDPDLYAKIKYHALCTANQKLSTWDERIKTEIVLIEKAIKEYHYKK